MKLKNFEITTKFENDTYYLFYGEKLEVTLPETVRLEEKVYRSIYCSDKTWLDTAIYLKDLSNVTLDFSGATLFLKDDTVQPFVLDGCENVTIKNVVVEYERSLLDEMDIVDVRDGEIWCLQTEKQKKHFPMKAENGCLIPICGNKEYRTALMAPHFLNLYDKESGASRSMCLVRIGSELPTIPWESFPFKSFELQAEQRGEYIVLRGEMPFGIMSGVTCAQCHADRDLNSCFIISSKNTKLENFRVLNGGGMGILGMYSENITLDRVRFEADERSHGLTTNAADAVHLIACFGKVEIINSVFEGMKDDALNIHGNYYSVQSVENGVIHAKIKTDIQANPAVNAHFRIFGKGDKLAVCDGGSTVRKQTLYVENVVVTGDFTADIYVKGDISNVKADDTVENLSAQADLHVQNCRFGKAFTHLRLQTRGKIVIEDCECSLKIALTGDKNYWYEGSPVTDLTVSNCRFLTDYAKIVACPEFDVCPQSPYYHSGVKVLGNVFDSENAMEFIYTQDIVFEGNTNANGKPFANSYRDCKNVLEK